MDKNEAWMLSAKAWYHEQNQYKTPDSDLTEAFSTILLRECKLRENRIKIFETALWEIHNTAGKWMSACQDDDNACDEIKKDFNTSLEVIYKTLEL
jgi:hypothetical protein